MKENEKLRIEERGNHATLEARLHVDKSHVQELRKKTETHYDQDGVGKLYEIKTSFFKRLISGSKREKESGESEESELCDISETAIILHTHRGYLSAKIKESKFDDYMINIKSEGLYVFVKEFYKYLRDISHLQPAGQKQNF